MSTFPMFLPITRPPAPLSRPPRPPYLIDSKYSLDPTYPGEEPTLLSSNGTRWFLHTKQSYAGLDPYRYPLKKLSELEELWENRVLEGRMRTSGVEVDSCQFQSYGVSDDRCFTRGVKWGNGGEGVLVGVFDGHVGPDLSDHTNGVLPPLLSDALSKSLSSLSTSTSPSPLPSSPEFSSIVTSTLHEVITTYDKSLGDTATSLFSTKPFEEWKEEEVKAILQKSNNGENNKTLRLTMTGSTALIAFIVKDKVCSKGGRLWIANVGDCHAYLGTKSDGKEPSVTRLNELHNGVITSEVRRLQSEHPGEEDTVISKERVLGALAVTRALGDFWFKLPPAFSTHILRYATPSFARYDRLEEALLHSHTPPYINAIPSITSHTFSSGDKLLLMSDGVPDSEELSSDSWTERTKARCLYDLVTSSSSIRWEGKLGHEFIREGEGNRAKGALRNLLWGLDERKGSKELGAEFKIRGTKLRDDITLVVCGL